MKTLEQLNQEKQNLRQQLNTAADPEQIIKLLKENEIQMQEVRTAQLLSNVNHKQKHLREIAAILWECEQPTEDITTADGSLHKVKAKKYPKLAALQYAFCKFEENHLTQISVNGHKFYMYHTKYEYGKPTVFTRPETFADFLKLNNIAADEITPEQFAQFNARLEQANRELKQAIAEYDKKRHSLNVSFMQYIGLVDQNSEHLYSYSAKKGY